MDQCIGSYVIDSLKALQFDTCAESKANEKYRQESKMSRDQTGEFRSVKF